MDDASRALLDRAKALANGATNSQMLLTAQDDSVDALKRAMNLLNTDDDPLLQPLPPMEPLACEAMLAEARGPTGAPASKQRKPRHAPSPPISDGGGSSRRSSDRKAKPKVAAPKVTVPAANSLVAAPLARNPELSPGITGGRHKDSAGASKVAADRVRQRLQEESEESEQKAREEADKQASVERASQQKAAKLATDAQERVHKAKRDAQQLSDEQTQREKEASELKAAGASEEEARLAAAAAAAAKRNSERRSAQEAEQAKLKAAEEEQKRLAQQKSDSIAGAAAVAAKKRVAAQKRAASKKKQEQDAAQQMQEQGRQARISDARAAQEEARRRDMAEQNHRRKQKAPRAAPLSPVQMPAVKLAGLEPQEASSPALSTGRSGGPATGRSSGSIASRAPTTVHTRQSNLVTRHHKPVPKPVPERPSVHQPIMEESVPKVVQHNQGDGYAITVDVTATPFRFAAEDAPSDDQPPSPGSCTSSPGGGRARGVRRQAPWEGAHHRGDAGDIGQAAASPEQQIEQDFICSLDARGGDYSYDGRAGGSQLTSPERWQQQREGAAQLRPDVDGDFSSKPEHSSYLQQSSDAARGTDGLKINTEGKFVCALDGRGGDYVYNAQAAAGRQLGNPARWQQQASGAEQLRADKDGDFSTQPEHSRFIAEQASPTPSSSSFDVKASSITANRARVATRQQARRPPRDSRSSYIAEVQPAEPSPSKEYHCGLKPPDTGSTQFSTESAKEVQRKKRRARQPPWKNRDPISVAPLEHYRAKLGGRGARPTSSDSNSPTQLGPKSPLVGLLGSRQVDKVGQNHADARQHLNSRSAALGMLGERKVKSSGDMCMERLEERSSRVSKKAFSRAMEVEQQQQRGGGGERGRGGGRSEYSAACW